MSESRLLSEIVPDQVLPKVLRTFDLVAVYVFIIFFVSGASIIAGGGWASMSMWVIGFAVFLVPAALAVLELSGLWPAQGGVYVWAYHTLSERWAFLGGFLSWIPVILSGMITPAAAVSYLSLAFGWNLSLTANIVLQLVLLWACVAFALRRLRLTQNVSNGVFVFYALLVIGVFVAGLAVALGNGGPAVPVENLVTVDFGTYGWIFGIVLLYLVGVETPFNMGAEFTQGSSAKRMVWAGSVALAVGYLLATAGVLLSTPADKIDPVTGVARVFGELGAGWLQSVAAVGIALISLTAFTIYQSAYSRLVFVSGLEKHLPRLFTHLNARTRNPVTALLIQGAISSVGVVILYSQQSLTTVFLSLQGALTVLWLASGYFFLVPVIVARFRYADRYANDTFWRIPGGRTVAIVVSGIGILATTAGIYYTFTLPFSPDVPAGTWMLNLAVICGVTLVVAGLVYFFGRRSASRLSEDQRLAHLATLGTEGTPQ
ncbi:APC family permease [Nonomuraea sp. M3C6]|uniref:APC family permease n=1 Tax=Nonomuraea marmarensis TaxID=3351344 RepID=A0ABW7AMF0_9ACTN